MDQQVISRWLLAAFGRNEQGRVVLSGFDKETGEYADHDAAEFMVEVDGHSPEVERAIGDMETPAAG